MLIKRFITIFLGIMLGISSAAMAMEDNNKQEQKTLVQKGRKIVATVNDFVANNPYYKFFLGTTVALVTYELCKKNLIPSSLKIVSAVYGNQMSVQGLTMALETPLRSYVISGGIALGVGALAAKFSNIATYVSIPVGLALGKLTTQKIYFLNNRDLFGWTHWSRFN